MDKIKVIAEAAERKLALDKNGYADWDYIRNEIIYKEHAGAAIDSNVKLAFSKLIEKVIKKDGNSIFSPTALYMAIAVLSQITANETRRQILDALGSDENNIKSVYDAVKSISESLSGEANCQVSESIWMNSNMQYNVEMLQILNEEYSVSSYTGEMGSDEMNKAISTWVKKSTGNMLQNDMDIKTNSEMLLDMFSTIYLGAKWVNKFWEKAKKGIFNLENGDSVKCYFMSKEEHTDYHIGDDFKAISKSLGGDYKAIFVLPNEGLRVDDLVDDKQVLELVCAGRINTTRKCDVSLKIPKFEMSSRHDLEDTLKSLGIRNAFKMGVADYTPISKIDLLYLSKAEQSTRIKVDEEGVIAASCVELSIACGCLPPEYEKVEFVVDRPFLFFVVASDTLPILAGKVKNPKEK